MPDEEAVRFAGGIPEIHDTLFGTLAVVVATALHHPPGAPRNLALTIIAGLGLGGLFVALARSDMIADPSEAGVPALAVPSRPRGTW